MLRAACAVAAVLLLNTAATAQTTERGPDNTLTAAERAQGWRLLFDGKSTKGWREYHGKAAPKGWYVADGQLRKDSPSGDLITTQQFANFDLVVDWKLAKGGNAGIFYHATEKYPKVYWSGPEYQLLDDANAPDGQDRLTSAGAAYAIYPSPAGIVKPADAWNHTEIIVRGNHVEHWLNGQKLLEYELNGDDWKARVAKSKFAAWPNYGKAKKGHIGIQGDHAAALALRNIKIRVLP